MKYFVFNSAAMLCSGKSHLLQRLFTTRSATIVVPLLLKRTFATEKPQEATADNSYQSALTSNRKVNLHQVLMKSARKTEESSLQPLEYERFVKRRLRLELIANKDFLQNKDLVLQLPFLRDAVISYISTIGDGDANSSPERKYQILVADIFSDSEQFERVLYTCRLRAERSEKQLDSFLRASGEKYPHIESFVKEMKDVLPRINCMSISM